MVARLVGIAEQHEAAARWGAAPPSLRPRLAVLSAANIYLAIARKVRKRGAHAWDRRVRTSVLGKLGAVFKGFMEALSPPVAVDQWPRWTRGEILLAVRMAGPIAPIPMTPLPDEGVQ